MATAELIIGGDDFNYDDAGFKASEVKKLKDFAQTIRKNEQSVWDTFEAAREAHSLFSLNPKTQKRDDAEGHFVENPVSFGKWCEEAAGISPVSGVKFARAGLIEPSKFSLDGDSIRRNIAPSAAYAIGQSIYSQTPEGKETKAKPKYAPATVKKLLKAAETGPVSKSLCDGVKEFSELPNSTKAVNQLIKDAQENHKGKASRRLKDVVASKCKLPGWQQTNRSKPKKTETGTLTGCKFRDDPLRDFVYFLSDFRDKYNGDKTVEKVFGEGFMASIFAGVERFEELTDQGEL